MHNNIEKKIENLVYNFAKGKETKMNYAQPQNKPKRLDLEEVRTDNFKIEIEDFVDENVEIFPQRNNIPRYENQAFSKPKSEADDELRYLFRDVNKNLRDLKILLRS